MKYHTCWCTKSLQSTVLTEIKFRPETGPEFPRNDQNPKLFDHFGEILELFRGGGECLGGGVELTFCEPRDCMSSCTLGFK